VVLGSTLLTLGYVVRLLERMYAADRGAADDSRVVDAAPALATDGGARATPERAETPVGDARFVLVAIAAAAVALGLAVGVVEPAVSPALEGFAAAEVRP
jgi:hypothetical protein